MKMSPHVDALRNDLASAAALGDELAAQVGARLADAVARSAPLRFLDALGEALLEANEQLQSGHLELRLAGNDPNVVLVADESDSKPAARDTETRSVARLTLRLPERLKSELEAAAAREGVSVNTWLVRALTGAVSHATRPSNPRRRLVGYGRT
jgi:HicB family